MMGTPHWKQTLVKVEMAQEQMMKLLRGTLFLSDFCGITELLL